MSTSELLATYGGILNELRRRGTIRSTNNPIADLAERLVALALKLDPVAKSTTGYDGIDSKGRKFEVKARRLTTHNRSRQLSAIRGMELNHFNFLVGVLFREDFVVDKACIIPHAVVLQESKHVKHTNSWKFLLRDAVWGIPGVQDITDKIRAIEHLA
jgi:hypothetical protein